jgi:hypothetical protein
VLIATLRTAPSAPSFGLLSFAGTPHRGGGDLRCRATLEEGGETYEVDLEMIDAYRRIMLRFFEIAADPEEAWSEQRGWSSEHSELSISIGPTNQDDLRLVVLMRWPPEYEASQDAILVVTRPALQNFGETVCELLR